MFFVECYADEIFISFIFSKLKIKGRLIHAGNKSKILRELSKKRAVGLVDQDPMAPQASVTKDYVQVIFDNSLQIEIYRNSLGSHLIVLHPRFEDWLLRMCELSRVDIGKYRFPGDPEELHKVINQKKRNLVALLDELYQKSKLFLRFIEVIRRVLINP